MVQTRLIRLLASYRLLGIFFAALLALTGALALARPAAAASPQLTIPPPNPCLLPSSHTPVITGYSYDSSADIVYVNVAITCPQYPNFRWMLNDPQPYSEFGGLAIYYVGQDQHTAQLPITSEQRGPYRIFSLFTRLLYYSVINPDNSHATSPPSAPVTVILPQNCGLCS